MNKNKKKKQTNGKSKYEMRFGALEFKIEIRFKMCWKMKLQMFKNQNRLNFKWCKHAIIHLLLAVRMAMKNEKSRHSQNVENELFSIIHLRNGCYFGVRIELNDFQ